MPSYDGIMNQEYYQGTSRIINLATDIGKLLGTVDATYLRKPTSKLRRANRIKSIQSSLWIEGNTLTEAQVSDVLENRKVIGPQKDILEVKNAVQVYNNILRFKHNKLSSYLSAHKMLMIGLVSDAGKFRTKGVGIVKGDEVAHIAPPAWNVKSLIEDLFDYLKSSDDNLIIKSCVFHYEMEFIHPFMDGNGRMGRLWQTVILIQENPVFEFLPIEHEIKSKQLEYYKALALSDKQGQCTAFVEYMLQIIKDSLTKLISQQRVTLSTDQRLIYFKEHFHQSEFVRKAYLAMFNDISSATATRDLKKGVEQGLWKKFGDDRLTRYRMS